jgi:hypothetical protein
MTARDLFPKDPAPLPPWVIAILFAVGVWIAITQFPKVYTP